MSEFSRACLRRARARVSPGDGVSPEGVDGWHSLCLELALEAGSRVRAARHLALGDQVSFKSDHTPTTDTELAVEQTMARHLAAFDPLAILVGEETGGTLPERGHAIAVDPIDGTWAFLGRTEAIATSLAVFRDGRVIAAAVLNPATGEAIHASVERATELVRLGFLGESDEVVALPLQSSEGARPLVNLQPTRDGALADAMRKAWASQALAVVRSPGGSPAWSLATTALGSFTYVNAWSTKGTADYDLAGGVFLVRAAGGEVVDLQGTPIDPLSHLGPFIAGMDRRAIETVRTIINGGALAPEWSPTMSQSDTGALGELLAQEGLGPDTLLYRANLPEFLELSQDGEGASLSANPDAVEAVVDVHGAGHTLVASEVGPGNTFSATRDNEWIGAGRVLVQVRLGDVLDQGGLVYPVNSVITDRVWYCTLPSGKVAVKILT